MESNETDIILHYLLKYPELSQIVGDAEFSPERFGENSGSDNYGKLFFPNATDDQIKEFNRTAMSLILHRQLMNGEYHKFAESQRENKLSQQTFTELREFMMFNFDTSEKNDLLAYYIIINDLGKTQALIDKVNPSSSADHDEILRMAVERDMLPSLKAFSDQDREYLLNVLTNGVNFGQYIQGECVPSCFEKLSTLCLTEQALMSAEAMLDIAGVAGHVVQKGSASFMQPTADNFLAGALSIQRTAYSSNIFSAYIKNRSDKFQIEAETDELRNMITRVCLMMRLSDPSDISVVHDEIIEHQNEYEVAIEELGKTQSNGKPEVLLYYSPATLVNALGYHKKNGTSDPITATLRDCLPFFQKSIQEAHAKAGSRGNDVITVMLRDAALQASANPGCLKTMSAEMW